MVVERNRAVLEQMHGLLGYQDRPGREIIVVRGNRVCKV